MMKTTFVRIEPAAPNLVAEEGCTLEPWTAGTRCPSCDLPGLWRSGVGFEHEMRCPNGCDPAPVWPGQCYVKLLRVVPAPEREPTTGEVLARKAREQANRLAREERLALDAGAMEFFYGSPAPPSIGNPPLTQKPKE